MLTNYIKTALRNVSRYRGYSAINVGGLTLGYAVVLVITFYVLFELSYDRFHSNSDRIHRVTVRHTSDEGVTEHHAGVSSGIGPILKEEYASVIRQARLINLKEIMRTTTMSIPGAGSGPISFHEQEAYFTDPSVLEIFDFKGISGKPENLLENPSGLLISRSAAQKYFGSRDPVGETILLNREYPYTVTGVYDDLPANSHIGIDFLLPMQSAADHGFIHFPNLHLYGDAFHTYLLLEEGSDESDLGPEFLETLSRRTDRRWDKTSLHLQPLTDIHLYSHLIGEHRPNSDATLVRAMGIIAVIILAMAWLNFVNLSLIRNSMRLREIGVRKSLGALGGQVRAQFIVEAVLVNLSALVFAVLLFEVAHPYLEQVFGFTLPSVVQIRPAGLVLMVLLVLSGTLFSGYASGWAFSHLKPSMVLKSQMAPAMSGGVFRKVIVTVQFACVYILIAGALTVDRQIRYLQDKDLGMELEKSVVIRGPELSPAGSRSESYADFMSRYRTFKDEMQRNPSVAGITTSNYYPGEAIDFQASLRRDRESNSLLVKRIFADSDFADVYGLEVKAGRFFGEDGHTQALVLNESAATALGFEEPSAAVGEEIFYFGNPATVVGVVGDFHFSGLMQPAEPLFFHENLDRSYITVKTHAGFTPEFIDGMENLWSDLFPGSPFDFFLSEERYGEQFKEQRRTGTLVGSFSLVAILISCMGLFGLTSLSMIKRIKEIGIRKILGATNLQVLGLLSRNYLHLILLSVIMALPVSYYLTRNWLNEFTYRMEPGWGLFLLPAIVVLTVAGLTIGLLMKQTVSVQPIKSIQSE